MKHTERIVWTLVVLGAFFAGLKIRYDGGGSPAPAADPSGDPQETKVVRREGSSSPRSNNALSAPERATLVERNALSSPVRTGRFLGMMAALDQVKPDTWQAMWDEFKRQTTEDGRVHETEWSLFMNRVGEVDGAAAMAFFEKNGQPEYTFNRGAVLLGWAATDPKAAIDWMDSQPPDSKNQQLQPTLLAGVVQADPELALSLLANGPGGNNPQMVQNFVSDLIQAKGIQWAMDHVLALDPGDDSIPAYVTTMEQEISNRTQRMSWLAGDGKAVQDWELRRAAALNHH